MKTKRMKGTIWTPKGVLTGKHEVFDPLPEKAASAEELLEQFMSNLVELYRRVAADQPVYAHRYVVQQLTRLKKIDPDTGEPSCEEEQQEFQDILLTAFKRRAGLLQETVDESSGSQTAE